VPKNYSKFDVYHTINFDFLFTFVSLTNNNIQKNNLSLEPELCIYGSILQKDTNQLSDLFLIYQTAISPIKLKSMMCAQLYDGNGFYCIMQFTTSSNKPTLVKVTFLSNGKIIETKKETSFNSNNFDLFSMMALKSGAFVLATIKYDVYGCNLTGYFLGSNNQWVNPDSNPKVYVDYPCSCDLLNNGTVIFALEKKEKHWTLSTLDIPNVMNGNYS
jgi:hypothetical protein